MKIKPLLCYMQAANYPEILKELEKIPCDKLILQYYPYPHPHEIARDFFLEHTEYTHLIIQPQDLLVTKENYFDLLKSVQEYDFPILGGVCNVERKGHKFYGVMNVTKICPTKIKRFRRYDWIPFPDFKMGIVQVGFMGMAFPFIKRNVLVRTKIDGSPIFQGKQGDLFPDLNFCLNCLDLDIPVRVDTDVRMIHYANHRPSLVGEMNCKELFIRYEENIIYGKSSTKSKV